MRLSWRAVPTTTLRRLVASGGILVVAGATRWVRRRACLLRPHGLPAQLYRAAQTALLLSPQPAVVCGVAAAGVNLRVTRPL